MSNQSSEIDLPISIVTEIIKKTISEDVCLSKSTKRAFSRLGGVFILYIANLANNMCKSKKKSKVLVRDVIEAMNKSGFSAYGEEINELMRKMTEEICEIREEMKGGKDKKDIGNNVEHERMAGSNEKVRVEVEN